MWARFMSLTKEGNPKKRRQHLFVLIAVFLSKKDCSALPLLSG